MASFEKKWRYQLRRMYPATDFTWLAAELLETATHGARGADRSAPSERASQTCDVHRARGLTIRQNPGRAA